ncbi:50S ribosomal protein L7ae-like protein [Virgibacillus ihumii]|uniref:50S ribosomal protein L7ae-like protein n=1 Tax=Virgibacillus ihumii TaxID=2686091 RepID=UPI00157C24D2|nr:50S ribosomal protein L7ae-like protein [Virgibacillus ihumii]
MSYEKVAQVKSNLIIGTKQTLKAIRNGQVSEVFIADDADHHITEKIELLADEMNVSCKRVDSMKRLGEACGIDVGASAAAVRQ